MLLLLGGAEGRFSRGAREIPLFIDGDEDDALVRPNLGAVA